MNVNIYFDGIFEEVTPSFLWEAIPGIASAISAILLLIITYRIFQWDSKRDIVDYVPQLFLRSEQKPVLHPVFSRNSSITNFYAEKHYQFYLVNLSNKKIVDLEVESEVTEDEKYIELLSHVYDSKENYIHWVDDKSFAYGGVLGDDFKSYHKEDLLSEGDTINIKVPGSFHLALLGYNLMAQKRATENIESKTININMSLEYNHAFTDKRISQKCNFLIKFSMGNNNTDVEWDSYLFEQK